MGRWWRTPCSWEERAGGMFLLLRLDCGIFSAAALEGAGITLGMENPRPGQDLARWWGMEAALVLLKGASDAPADRRLWMTLMTLMTRFGFCSWALMTSLGLGGDQSHWWPVPSVCNHGFCSLVLCIFLPLLPNWKPNHIHRTAPREKWQRWDSCKTDRIITPTFTSAVSAAWNGTDLQFWALFGHN